jgi:diguanylate cyclase (GGDEF)-like protein
MAIARNIRDRVLALGIPHEKSDAAPYVTVSLGVATAICSPDIDSMSWIRAADSQLYQAKASGRNDVAGRVFLEAEMKNARLRNAAA